MAETTPSHSVPRGPFEAVPPGPHLSLETRRVLLARALTGIELGAWDERALNWLAEADTPIVRSIVGMIERARQASA
jgi:hypothetical protein